jgi:putative transposase
VNGGISVAKEEFKIYDLNPQMQELKVAIKQNKDKAMHVRYMCIYQYLKGVANVESAKMYNVCPHTVGKYIKKYKEQGLKALVPAPKCGAPKRMTKEQEEKLVEVILTKTPDEVGFNSRKNWNSLIVMQWAIENFGIEYSHSGMLKVLHRLNLSFTRPTYTLAKADAKKQEEFVKRFELLKKPS